MSLQNDSCLKLYKRFRLNRESLEGFYFTLGLLQFNVISPSQETKF
jgi:hypothetical protein